MPFIELIESPGMPKRTPPTIFLESSNRTPSRTVTYLPDSQGPTPPSPLRTQCNYAISEARRRRNRKAQERRRRANQRILDGKINEVSDLIALPGHSSRAIINASERAQNMGLKICAIDLENATVRLRDKTTFQVPIWVAIVNGNRDIIYHEFIRHPTSSLVLPEFGTACHGLTPKDVNKGKRFIQVRQEVLNILGCYDRIVVSGQAEDFVSLFVSLEEHKKLLPKLVCVSSYYNCRVKANALGLKYAAFLMFNTVVQQGAHSPLVDAFTTLYLYLIDFNRIEKVKSTLSETHNIYAGFVGHLYPKNRYMARLLRDTMKIIRDWPNAIKFGPYGSLCKPYESTDFVSGIHPNQNAFPYRMFHRRRLMLNQIRDSRVM